MFVILIMVIVSWVYAHVLTHQIEDIEYMQFLAYEIYLNKTVKKE